MTMIGTRGGQAMPLVFSAPPVREQDGRRYVDRDAARELGDLAAARYDELLERLADA